MNCAKQYTCNIYILRNWKIRSSFQVVDCLPSVNRLDHHLNCSQGVWPASVFGPKNSILVLASVMASSVPYAIEVRMGTGVVPPSSFMKVGAVSWIHIFISVQCGELFPIMPHHGIPRISLVSAQTQSIELTLRFQAKATIFCVDFFITPVF